ncbi:helix-turn-helix domain-containing protein [Azospirillum thermophilum]|uniref:Transcriptional regulator n=1 Tax=Azospirillum thermophilum TaxID=2202148 RepID=A0A2S2D1I7_9PROT|nr:transcriptional regulator [Azospirillum thermophilum]AWK90307.1 transcriptional regulator [Azospirillum thermophilum]
MADEMTDEALSKMRPMPLAKRARAVTGLTQAAFCERFGIPLTCQRDWEQGRASPPEASASYLTAILHDHAAVAAAFNAAAE